MKTQQLKLAHLAVLGTLSLALAGCSESLTLPEATNPSSALAATAGSYPPDIPGWTRIAQANVPVGHATTLAGSRYTVTFQPHSFQHAIKVAMFERYPNVLDVNLEPDGIEFEGEVTLTIDYAGTQYDPDAPGFAGAAPQAGRFNSAMKRWAPYPGAVNDTENKTLTLVLHGFSRYGLMRGSQADGGRVLGDDFEQWK